MKNKKYNLFQKLETLEPEDLKKSLLTLTLVFLVLFTGLVWKIDSDMTKSLEALNNQKIPSPLESKITDLVKGYPIEEMSPFISQKGERLAAFLVAIAKKESNWGKRVPVREGKDCYNYWGYRGVRDKMGSDGHTCFDSPEDAVNTVSKRLDYFVNEKKLVRPEDLVVWKCGSTCEGHSRYDVNKWIKDVDLYYNKVAD